MSVSKADLVLHPARIRIIQALQGRQLTPYQLGKVLPDISQATLYRHIKKLCNAGIVRVVSERQVHGAIEGLYEMVEDASNLTAEEFASISREDHQQFFQAFMGSALGAFRRYIEQESLDVLKDGFRYYGETLYMTEAEFAELWKDIHRLVAPHLLNQPAPGRTRRIVNVQAIPEAEPTLTPPDES